MVWYRAQVRRLVSRGILPLGVLVLAGLCTYGPARSAGAGAAQPSGSNARIRKLMTQRYEILQRAMRNSQLMFDTGRLDFPTLRNVTLALYRAQADLATTDADRVQVYEKLVDALIAQEKLLERQSASGRLTEMQVDEGRVATLSARIDLERLRLGQAPAQP